MWKQIVRDIGTALLLATMISLTIAGAVLGVVFLLGTRP